MDQESLPRKVLRRKSYLKGIKKKKQSAQRAGRMRRIKNAIKSKSIEINSLKLSNKSLEKDVSNALTDQKKTKRLGKIDSYS